MLVLTACSTLEPSKENKAESHTKQTDTKTTKDNKSKIRLILKRRMKKTKILYLTFLKGKIGFSFCVDHVDQYTLTKMKF